MDYNTNRPRLKLPEFGRHIQQMVDYCRTIEDRDERQACAETIAAYLCRLFPDEMNAREWPSTKAWDTTLFRYWQILTLMWISRVR